MSMKEIAADPSLRASGTVAEVEHKERGKYLTVGSPIKFSDMKVEITGSPLLGEHTDEVLKKLGYNATQIAALHKAQAV
jgi:formyl-CoA transferase